MIIKIFLVTILIMLSWNSFKNSESNEYLRAQLKELTLNSESLTKLTSGNKDLLQKQTVSLEKNSDLSVINESILQKTTDLEKKIAEFTGIKASIDKIQKSTDKQTNLLNDSKKVITSFKKPIYATLDIIKKHSKVQVKNSSLISSKLDENKKIIISMKKPLYATLDAVNNQSIIHSKNANYLASMNICRSGDYGTGKKPTYLKKKKSNVGKTNESLFNKLLFEFNRTKELHNKKQTKRALAQLAKLKTEVWKSRNMKNISKDKIISLLTSIEIIEKKWEKIEVNNDLKNIEKIINSLVSIKSGTPILKKKITSSPSSQKVVSKIDTNLLNTLSLELNKTKTLLDKKAATEAIIQLAKLKTEVWKSRNLDYISKDKVMSILSSIDSTKKKWENNELDYGLENIEKKINLLFSKTNEKPVKVEIKAKTSDLKKSSSKTDVSPFDGLLIELKKTKESHNKKETKQALIQLDNLKTKVWKSRNLKNTSKDLIMSIMSSIDFTKKKWENNEIDFDLANIEKKINSLVLDK